MRAHVQATFECEAVLLTGIIRGEKLDIDECGASTTGHLLVCLGSVIEHAIAGVIPGGEVKVVQPLGVSLGPEANEAGWIMHHERGSVLVICPEHRALVTMRRAQLEKAGESAREQEKVDGNIDGMQLEHSGGEGGGEERTDPSSGVEGDLAK